MFLAHFEKGLKRHYAERDWNRLATAITELRIKFELDDECS